MQRRSRLGLLTSLITLFLLAVPIANAQQSFGNQPPAATTASTSTDESGKTVQTVIANGFGSTIESAVQNAAENALIQVVGSFIDTEHQIDHRSEINQGVRSEVKKISSKTREYSQGSIHDFTVLDQHQENGVTRVTAKIGVRIDDFKAYMRQAIQGDVKINKGLFAQAASSAQQAADASHVFIDRVMTPLRDYDGASITVGSPQKVSIRAEDLPCATYNQSNERRSACPSSFTNWVNARRQSADNIYKFPVMLTIDSAVLQQLFNVGRTLSNNACPSIDLRSTLNQYGRQYGSSPDDRIAQAMANVYRDFPEESRSIQQDVAMYRADPNFHMVSQHRYVALLLRSSDTPITDTCLISVSDPLAYEKAKRGFTKVSFELSILTADGDIVERYNFSPYKSVYDASTASTPNYRQILVTVNNGSVNNLQTYFDLFNPVPKQQFDIYVSVPLEVLSKADRAVVKVIN